MSLSMVLLIKKELEYSICSGKRCLSHKIEHMLLGIFAKKVESSVTEDGGELLLHYTIDVNADLASSNELKITVSGQ